MEYGKWCIHGLTTDQVAKNDVSPQSRSKDGTACGAGTGVARKRRTTLANRSLGRTMLDATASGPGLPKRPASPKVIDDCVSAWQRQASTE
jgi:hypothetical protein